MKILLTLKCLFLSAVVFAQTDTTHLIKIHFLYGSRPLRAHKATEPKYFGGLYGGHVTIQADSTDYGFRRVVKRTHIFPRKKHNSVFVTREMNGQPRYKADRKTATFLIPITQQQHESLHRIHRSYLDISPYDYAFFGMRCASATQEILGQIGILKNRSRFGHVFTAFYPQRLRKRLFRLAKENNYKIIRTEGRLTRKWERDYRSFLEI